jgi:hypothetical protein
MSLVVNGKPVRKKRSSKTEKRRIARKIARYLKEKGISGGVLRDPKGLFKKPKGSVEGALREAGYLLPVKKPKGS